MDDSNIQPASTADQAPLAPTTEPQAPAIPKPPTAQQPKTFLQQFQDMQSLVFRHDSLLQETEMAFSITASGLKQCINEITLINDQLQAMYLLSEENTSLTRVNVANKVQQIRIDGVKAKLQKDEAAGLIRKIDAVVDQKSIVLYDDESKGLTYSYNPAGKFGKDLAPQFIGKKIGDVIGTVKILGLYELVPEESRPQTPADQQAQ